MLAGPGGCTIELPAYLPSGAEPARLTGTYLGLNASISVEIYRPLSVQIALADATLNRLAPIGPTAPPPAPRSPEATASTPPPGAPPLHPPPDTPRFPDPLLECDGTPMYQWTSAKLIIDGLDATPLAVILSADPRIASVSLLNRVSGHETGSTVML